MAEHITSFQLPSCGPRGSVAVEIPLLPEHLVVPRRIPAHAEVHVTLSFRYRRQPKWTPSYGFELAWLQIPLHDFDASHAPPSPWLALHPLLSTVVGSAPTTCRINQDLLSVTTALGSALEFDVSRGVLVGWTADHGRAPILVATKGDTASHAAVLPGLWRPPTDNDVPHALPHWKMFGVQALRPLQCDKFEVFQESEETTGSDGRPSGSVVIRSHSVLAPPSLPWAVEAEVEYRIFSVSTDIAPWPPADPNKDNICRQSRDVLEIRVGLIPTGPVPNHVPLIGLDLRLAPHFADACRISYLGLGPGEAYPDKCSAQRVGIWQFEDADELETKYEVPQEGGNRMGVRWLRLHVDALRAKRGGELLCRSLTMPECANGSSIWSAPQPQPNPLPRPPFSFQLSRYSATAVEAAAHPCDLIPEPDGSLLLRLDSEVSGVGTAACGPGVADEFLVRLDGPKRFGFVLEWSRPAEVPAAY